MKDEPQEDVFSDKLDLSLWSRVFRHALPYKKLLVPLAVAAVGIALCDASFALVTRWTVDAVATQIGSVAPDAAQDGAKLNLVPYVSVYLGLALALSIGVWAFINAAGGLSNNMSHDIRAECFKKLQELEFAYFDHRPTGWLISRLTSDCDKLARIIAWGTLDVLWAVCLVIMIAVVMVVLNPVLGLLVLSVVPPLLFISAVFQKKLLLSSRETRKYNSMITASFAEALQGLRTTKSLVREVENHREFAGVSTQMYDVSIRNALQSAVYIPIVLALGSVAAGIALWHGGADVMSGTLSLGTLVAFIFYAGQFFNPINQIAQTLVQMQGAQAAGERVLSLLATVAEIRDSEEVRARMAQWDLALAKGDLASATAPDGFAREIQSITFDHVDFAYLTGEPVLKDFNLTVLAGQTIALVGASGGGKSTIVNLAARFYEPTGGRILVNGQDLKERSLEWYHSNLGIVLQGPHLF
ncbi:MAG TPA: ABC transporter transmembrane domain-containing protein, partial [Verrucomicrobium sp.]|nr:ABC transporter transmembrane domain-containing protein [Verrucomicrobium sp.]